MVGTWLLRSPYNDELHLAVHSKDTETLARLVRWSSVDSKVLDASLLPANLRAIAWRGDDQSVPTCLAVVSATAVQVVDLAFRSDALRVKRTVQLPMPVNSYGGALASCVAWVGGRVVFAQAGAVHAVDVMAGGPMWSYNTTAQPAAARSAVRSKADSAYSSSSPSRSWAGGGRLPLGAVVRSLEVVSSHEVVVSWAFSDKSRNSAGVRVLDLSVHPSDPACARQLVEPSACKWVVEGFSQAHLDRDLVAGYCLTEASELQVFVWDLRQHYSEPDRYVRRRGAVAAPQSGTGSPPALLASKAGRARLEWSPTKRGTLLAFVGGWTGGDATPATASPNTPGGAAEANIRPAGEEEQRENPRIFVLRLWEQNTDSLEVSAVPVATGPFPSLYGSLRRQVSGSEPAARWIGEARELRAGPEEVGSSSLFPEAAAWGHMSCPGLALVLRNDGQIHARRQPVGQICAWSARGGALVASPWAAACPPGAHTSGVEAVTGSGNANVGLAAVVAPLRFPRGRHDICTIMRLRAECARYGAEKMSFDDYSRAVRGVCGGDAVSEALASMWQWFKSADAVAGKCPHEDGNEDGAYGPTTLPGTLLLLEEEAVGAKPTTTVGGVIWYPERSEALKALGFEASTTLPPVAHQPPLAAVSSNLSREITLVFEEVPTPSRGQTSQAVPAAIAGAADEAARRVLREILWLEFDKAFLECSHLASFFLGIQKTNIASLLMRCAFVIQAAPPCLTAQAVALARESTAAEGVHDGEAMRPQFPPQTAWLVQMFETSLHSVMVDDWREVPSATTLRYALLLIQTLVRAAHAPNAAASFEAAVHRLVMAPSEQLTSVEDWSEYKMPPSPNANTTPVVATSIRAANEKIGRDHVKVRPSAAFLAAVAVRFLPWHLLKPALQHIKNDCKDAGLLDSLCVTGLGGASDAKPISVEDFAEDASRDDFIFRQRINSDGGAIDVGAALVEAYVERTGDVQSAALIFCHAAHLMKPPVRLKRCFLQYSTLLARWHLTRLRAELHELAIARLPPKEQLRPMGCALFCYYCNTALTGPSPNKLKDIDAFARVCPKEGCGKATPHCCVCLLPVLVVTNRSPEAADLERVTRSLDFESWVAWCQACHHGGHVDHLDTWFSNHTECPVAGCQCRCNIY